MRRIVVVLVCLSILVFGISQAARALDLRQQRNDVDVALEKLLPRPQDYPPDAQELSRKAVSLDEQSHPLNRFNPAFSDLSKPIYNYLGAYELTLVVPDGQNSAFAGYFLYAYPDAQQAQIAVEILQKSLSNFYGTASSERLEVGEASLQGTVSIFTTPEGDRIYYFVGVQDKVLTLFIVNGQAQDTLQSTYAALLRTLLLR
jgi:hypothetical protein